MARREKSADEIDLESIEIELLLIGLWRRWGYDFRGYDPKFLKKEIARRAREEGFETVSRLSERLLRDPAILERFLAQLSGAGDPLFSPAGFWRSFRKNIAAYLRTYPTLRLWLMDGRPEEICALSILLEEDLPRNVRIYATELHDSLVEKVRRGALPAESLREGAEDYRRSGGRRRLSKYFERENGSAVLSPALRNKIVFASHNPVTDGPFQRFHAVLARNVLGPFDGELRKKTYGLLHESLITLGFLAVGSAEGVKDSPFRECYREIDKAAGIYQKVRE